MHTAGAFPELQRYRPRPLAKLIAPRHSGSIVRELIHLDTDDAVLPAEEEAAIVRRKSP
jgi:hypothetical protein